MLFIHNKTEATRYYCGNPIDADAYYQIPGNLRLKYAASDDLIADLAADLVAISVDGAVDIAGLAAQTAALMDTATREVVTQFEKNDKTLKICGDKGTIDNTTKKCQLKFLVPGTPGSGDCRFVSGGKAWVWPYSSTARVRVFIADDDNILGYGAGTVVSTYTDTEQPTAKQNWYIPPIGHVEAETIGGYGDVPAGLYLVTEFEDDAGGATAYCNLEWGKAE